MVRVTIDDRGPTAYMKIEGRLVGAWVSELDQCWRTYCTRSPRKKLVADLSKTEFVDLAGKYLLTLMYRSGVRFTVCTPYMDALLAEIAGTGPAAKREAADRQSK